MIATNETTRTLVVTHVDRILDMVRRAYHGRRPAAKLLASDADVSPRTAEAWLAGRNLPSAEPLLRLMLARPDLRAELQADIARLGALKLGRVQRERVDEDMGFAPRGGSDQAVRRVRTAVAVPEDTGRDADHRALGDGRPDPRLPLAG